MVWDISQSVVVLVRILGYQKFYILVRGLGLVISVRGFGYMPVVWDISQRFMMSVRDFDISQWFGISVRVLWY